MVSALFTAFALIAAGQAEIPSAQSTVSNVRSERAGATRLPRDGLRRDTHQVRRRNG